MNINSEQLVQQAYKTANDLKAIDPLILDVREHCSFTDYFLICSASSHPQLSAIEENIHRKFKGMGVHLFTPCLKTEDSCWLLMDYGDFIVHIFMEEARQFYNLEQLWKRSPQVEPQCC
ncbi:MAG: ribosome silencing factor [Candidatus Schekmanbacteria bacterium]|nr:ribosome silencing factor [Candidatus Schekmanbacteria bacterium]